MHALLAVIAVLGVSASGPLMAAAPAPALSIAMWRNAGATVLLSPFAAGEAARRGSWRQLRDQKRREWLECVFASVMLAGHFALWVTALKLTSVAAATALVSLQAVWVVVVERLGGRSVGPLVLVGITCAIAGVVVISGIDFALSRRAVTGDMLALAGGLCNALYLVTGKRVRVRLSTTMYTTICYGMCAIVLAVAAAAAGVDMVGLTARAWLLIAAVAVSSQFVGHSLINYLLATLSARVMAMLLLLEVPGAALLASAFLHQAPGAGVYGGLALILVGLVIVSVRRRPADPLPAG